jgi:myosin heavy subunit
LCAYSALLSVQRVTVGKNVVLEELTWSSLRRPVRDLVMLDVMNQPLILYNLRDRFKQNEIYVSDRH